MHPLIRNGKCIFSLVMTLIYSSYYKLPSLVWRTDGLCVALRELLLNRIIDHHFGQSWLACCQLWHAKRGEGSQLHSLLYTIIILHSLPYQIAHTKHTYLHWPKPSKGTFFIYLLSYAKMSRQKPGFWRHHAILKNSTDILGARKSSLTKCWPDLSWSLCVQVILSSQSS